MKKFFTSISLVAMGFIAAVPVAAQQQNLTDQEKAALAKTIVPAVFEQMKQISGVDLMALANPNIEDIITSPLFFPQTAGLRADALASVSMTPDSMKLDLSALDLAAMLPDDMAQLAPMLQGLLKEVKLTFSNYKEYRLSTASFSWSIQLPEKIDVSLAAMTDTETGKPANLLSVLLVTGEKGAILPFNSLSVELKLDKLEQLGALFGDKFPLKSGKLLTVAETKQTSGAVDYDITLEENLRGLIDTTGVIPNFQITVDMTKLTSAGTIQAGLFAKPLQMPNVKLPMGDALVYANLKAGASLPADSIVLISYKAGTVDIEGYKKLAPVMKVDGAALKLTTTSSVRANTADAWKETALQIVTMPASMGPTIQSVLSSLVGQLTGGLRADMNQSFAISVDSVYATDMSDTIRVMEIDGKIEMQPVDLKQTNLVANFDFKTKETEGLVTTMNIKATVSNKAPNILVEFSPAAMQMETPMATAYMTSDLLGVLMDNETIAPADRLQVKVAENGLYVENCDKGTYSIVSMNGVTVAQGVISGPGAFIATPSLGRGQIYILTVVDKGAATSIKFRK